MNEAYLTDNDFTIAKTNGIDYQTAYKRFNDYGWDKQKAITEPKQRRFGNPVSSFTPEQKMIAESNGIYIQLLWRRVHKLNWSVEDAIHKPPERRIKRG